MPDQLNNSTIPPKLSSALQDAFGTPNIQPQIPTTGLWQAIVNKLNNQPEQLPQPPTTAAVDPYSNFANKATGLPYK